MVFRKVKQWLDKDKVQKGDREAALQMINKLTPALSDYLGYNVKGFLHDKKYIIAFYKESLKPLGFRLIGDDFEVTSYMLITEYTNNINIKYEDPLYILKTNAIESLIRDLEEGNSPEDVVNSAMGVYFADLDDSGFC